MDKAEFDKFADEYHSLHARNIRASGEEPEFFAEYKVQDLVRLLSRRSASVRRILDFGAGVGTSVPHFRHYFPSATLICIDVSERSLEIGASRHPGTADFRLFDGAHIPFEDANFDLVFAACVFHHIPASEHVGLIAEMRRVLQPGAPLVVFEHNPWNPLTVRAVESCPFDENAVLLHAAQLKSTFEKAAFCSVNVTYRIFFPHFLRGLRPLERFLGWCPLGAQYSVVGIK